MTQFDPTSVSPEFGHWLAGFVDGEGCFLIQRQRSPRALNWSFAFRFALFLRDDDIAILHEIHETTKLGRISLAKRSKDNAYHPQAGWVVYDKRECLALVRLFDRYPLRAKKARDFAVWREAIIHWQQVSYRGSRSGNWGPIQDLWAELKRAREYDPNVERRTPDPACAQLELLEAA